MWAVLSKDCKTESNNMFRNSSAMALLSKKVTLQLVRANILTSQQLQTQSFTHYSVIEFHLLHNPTCAQLYDNSMFFILAKGHSPFHLSALKATLIKTSYPILCRQ